MFHIKSHRTSIQLIQFKTIGYSIPNLLLWISIGLASIFLIKNTLTASTNELNFNSPQNSEEESAYANVIEDNVPVNILSQHTLSVLHQFASSKVVLFGTAECGYCAATRNLLNAKHVEFADYDVEEDLNASNFINDVIQSSGVPVLIIGNHLILGWDEAAMLNGIAHL